MDGTRTFWKSNPQVPLHSGKEQAGGFRERGGSHLRVLLALIVFFAGLFIVQRLMDRQGASTSDAGRHVRAIVSAQENYFATRGRGRYADTLEQLREAGLLGNGSDSPAPAGYLFDLFTEGGGKGFTVVARPRLYGQTGVRSYRADQTGVVRSTDENRLARSDDPAF